MVYKLIAETLVNKEVIVKKYVSTDTGVLVYVAQVDSPITNAYLVLGETQINCIFTFLII